ncbi:MAG: 4Fe-4S binding protein [Desulfobacterales bacterium]|nr:4Fe-4S binding protein [Desulfobacterales bacterium]MBS3755023.1 4Fe-4S binding protein [Desulfobacterales bacterium]
MTSQTNIDEKYKQAGHVISTAGGTPVPVNDTLVKLLRYFIREDELDFILAFRDRTSQTLEQLMETTGLSETEILDKTRALAARGVIFNQPNRHGVTVYRLLPLLNVGTFEYTFMGKVEDTERNREISALFDQLFDELSEMVQQNYDNLLPSLMQMPPIDRTVPVTENKSTGESIRIEVDESLDASVDRILPTSEVTALIEKFDEIALGHCFCRHHKDISGQPCRQSDLRETCFTFGKSARYTTEQGFARMVSRQEALDVLKKAEADGLVHKAYHPNFDINKAETSICNCCRCCCGNSVENMIAPITNATNFLAVIDTDLCTGCGTCVEQCHTGAAYLGGEGIAQRDTELCIGCGVCAAFCPENAIFLHEGETRIVRIPPKRKSR